MPQPDSTRDWGGPPLGAIREAASELIAIAEERFPDKFSEIVSKGHVETSERQNRRTAGLGLEDRDDVLPGRELRLWGRLPGRTHLLDLAQQADGHGAAACGGHSLSVLHQLLLGTLLDVLGMVVKETGEVFLLGARVQGADDVLQARADARTVARAATGGGPPWPLGSPAMETINGCTVVPPSEAPEPVHFGPAESQAAYVVIVGTFAPGQPAPPLHVHPHTDEAFYVADGDATFRLGEREVPVVAGGLVFVPRGCPHTVWNSGDRPVRGLILVSPGDAEHEFVLVERG